MERAMRRSFTLVEMVFVIVIVALLSVATFKALSMLMVRSYKAKEETRLSLESQVAIDQIANYLQERIPASVIGYDPTTGTFKSIYDIEDQDGYKIVEWLQRATDERLDGLYSGFIDIKASQVAKELISYGLRLQGNYWLIFAGSFDDAASSVDLSEAFGWHGHGRASIYDVELKPGSMRILGSHQPARIYERYFLTKSAVAIARGEDVDKQAACLRDLRIDDDTLLLFYDYKPWLKQTFCADPKSGSLDRSGSVAVLMENVQGFRIRWQDGTIRVLMDIYKPIKDAAALHFTKMKVVW